MKISIITATYNSEKTLRDTLDSILAQTYPDIESIIVDGASKDGTMDIVREYEPKFQGRMHWISEPDKGIYDAMNKGIKMASGDVIGVLNSDDFYHDERVVEDIANAFIQKNVECVYGNLVFIDENDKNNTTTVNILLNVVVISFTVVIVNIVVIVFISVVFSINVLR